MKSLQKVQQSVSCYADGYCCRYGDPGSILGLVEHCPDIMTVAPAVAMSGAVKIAIAAIGGPVTIVIAVITALVLNRSTWIILPRNSRNRSNAVFDAVGNKLNAAINTIIGVFQSWIAYYKNAVSDIRAA